MVKTKSHEDGKNKGIVAILTYAVHSNLYPYKSTVKLLHFFNVYGQTSEDQSKFSNKICNYKINAMNAIAKI